ncbi:hypothetical protein COL516b_011909 [Colletotrichum fioriniae]|nr:uncharacterized protein COL516b_011909 [Colletotrichum fioriniae]KAJ0296157.1 hypothetical protein COL516b_011909 [Colletotrichum fioriniae]
MSQATSTKCASRWVTRIIPLIITGTSGYATYVVVAYLGVDYLYRTRGEHGAAISTITLYLFFYLLTIATYLRTFLKIKADPGLVPLGPQAQQALRESNKKSRRRKEGDLESQPYFTGPDQDPDSPGLEGFYSKDVFACESDGRPKWCSECRNWKPDRAHHSSEVERCVRKMDHYCPWVGGMVSETSIRVPNGTRPGNSYGLITYPLPKYPQGIPTSSDATVDSETPRDRLATRTFAIVRTEPDENPWDLGYARNWTSIMGYTLIDWLLPIRGSPCANHDSMESDYEMGPLVQRLRERHGLPDPNGSSSGREMQELRDSDH